MDDLDDLGDVPCTHRTKDELLKKYAGIEPRDFIQMDAYAGDADDEDPDPDRDRLSACETTELMKGSDVRILFRQGISQTEGVRLLKKLMSYLERGNHLTRWGQDVLGQDVNEGNGFKLHLVRPSDCQPNAPGKDWGAS